MDISWQKILVSVAALVFAGFLLWKSRPRLPLPRFRRRSRLVAKRSPEAIKEQIRSAREQARRATTPGDRAKSLVLAAEAAAEAEGGLTSAMGLYLRAMRADATSCDPILGIAALLRKERPELLESVLWRRLAHLPFSGETAPVAKCTIETLAHLYRRELRHRDRARALQKLLAKF